MRGFFIPFFRRGVFTRNAAVVGRRPRIRVHEGVMGCGDVVVCHRNARVRGVRGRSVGVYAHLILPLALTPLIQGRP